MDSLLDKIESIVKRAFDFFDDIEIFFFSLIAGLIAIGGPILLIIRFINECDIWKAIAVISVFCICVYYCVRDYRRKKFSWISITVVVIWLVLTIVLSLVIFI